MNIINLFPDISASKVTDQTHSPEELKVVRDRIVRTLNSSQVKIYLYFEVTADLKGDLKTSVSELATVLHTDIRTVSRDIHALEKKQLILSKTVTRRISTPPFRPRGLGIRVLPLMAGAQTARSAESKTGPTVKAKRLAQEFLEFFDLYPCTRDFRQQTEEIIQEEIQEGFSDGEIRFNWQEHIKNRILSYVYVHRTITHNAKSFRHQRRDAKNKIQPLPVVSPEAPPSPKDISPLHDVVTSTDKEQSLYKNLVASYTGPHSLVLSGACLKWEKEMVFLHIVDNPYINQQAQKARPALLEALKKLNPAVRYLKVISH